MEFAFEMSGEVTVEIFNGQYRIVGGLFIYTKWNDEKSISVKSFFFTLLFSFVCTELAAPCDFRKPQII